MTFVFMHIVSSPVAAILFSMQPENQYVTISANDYIEIDIIAYQQMAGDAVYLDRQTLGYHEETVNRAGDSATFSRLRCGDLRSIDLGHFSTFVRATLSDIENFYFMLAIKKDKKLLYTRRFSEQIQGDDENSDTYFISILAKGNNEYIVNPGPIVIQDS